MSRRFRRLEDPEDVVQSAFRTFFRRNARGEFHFDSSADLWRLLATITRRKILKHVERLGAGKRDPGREVHAEGDELSGREPTPEEAALAADLMEKALADFDETYVKSCICGCRTAPSGKSPRPWDATGTSSASSWIASAAGWKA